MKSKEEIIKEHSFPDFDDDGCYVDDFTDTLACMDEYAKEISIGFAEWLGGEGYQNYDGKDRWSAPHKNNHVYSTKEVYELFLSTPPPNNVI